MHRFHKAAIVTAGFCLAMAAASPALAQNCKPLTQRGSIKLERPNPNAPWFIPVGINGVPKRMLLRTDTGGTLITPEVVEELNLPVRYARGTTVVSADGMRSAGYTHIDRFALGLAGQFSNSDLAIMPPLSNGAKRPTSGSVGDLGLDFLTHFDFDMDLQNGVLNLFDLDHCEGQVVYWKTAGAVAIIFTYDVRGRIKVRVKLDGADMDAVLSTSDTIDQGNLDIFKSSLKFDENAADVEKLPDYSNGAKVYRKRFKTLEFSGLTINNPLVTVAEDKMKRQLAATNTARIGSSVRDTESNREPDLTLGLNTLSKLHVYVASKERKLYISPLGQ